jgi:hypothetical protein
MHIPEHLLSDQVLLRETLIVLIELGIFRNEPISREGFVNSEMTKDLVYSMTDLPRQLAKQSLGPRSQRRKLAKGRATNLHSLTLVATRLVATTLAATVFAATTPAAMDEDALPD